jgi:hypothetical protein
VITVITEIIKKTTRKVFKSLLFFSIVYSITDLFN